MTFGLDESLPVSESAGLVNSVVAWRGAARAATVGSQECPIPPGPQLFRRPSPHALLSRRDEDSEYEHAGEHWAAAVAANA
jgi:hypothetical protein